jgi:hypothetical protein
MTKRLLPLAALVTLAAACVNGDATTGQLEEAMVNAGADQDQAECVRDRFDEALGENDLDQAQLNEISDASDLNDLPNDLQGQVDSILDDCLAQDGAASGGGAPSDTGTDADAGGNGANDGESNEADS